MVTSMKIAMVQMSSVVGDYLGNRQKILQFSVDAKAKGADIVVFPEAALCGYPPQDLLRYDAFLEDSGQAIKYLCEQLPHGIVIFFGCIRAHTTIHTQLYNGVIGICDGRVVYWQSKTLLPTYDVFDEARYFTPADSWDIYTVAGLRCGINICEDIWLYSSLNDQSYNLDPVDAMMQQACDLLIIPSASPYERRKLEYRIDLLRNIWENYKKPMLYVNSVGGNDSLIFDGYSMYMNAEGRITEMMPGFVEDMFILDLNLTEKEIPSSKTARGLSHVTTALSAEAELSNMEQSLELGIRSYVQRTGFSRVHLGLSGGIDSALVATLASRALGPENVQCFLLPSVFTSAASGDDARKLVESLGIHCQELPIRSLMDAYTQVLEPLIPSFAESVASENIQARIRGNLLMAYSNHHHSLLLATGNKSELSVGYCTLYGDMAGGLAPLGDVFKTEVYELCSFINRDAEIIPQEILQKAPSAELRPDQKDEDSLPPYDILDAILGLYIVEERDSRAIIERGYDVDTVERVIQMVCYAEFKRFQAAPVLRVSSRAFGQGRRIPIARINPVQYS